MSPGKPGPVCLFPIGNVLNLLDLFVLYCSFGHFDMGAGECVSCEIVMVLHCDIHK